MCKLRILRAEEQVGSMMTRLSIAAVGMVTIVVAVLPVGAVAQHESGRITSPPTNQIEKHVHNYGDLDQTCIRWTDRCRNCGRDIDGAPACSNIGVVCVPGEVECVERRKSEEKK
jgi:hypothetical protein